MKISKLTKIVLIILISMSILFVATDTLADSKDLANYLTQDTSNGFIPISGNEVLSDDDNKTPNNVVLTTNNTSDYNNSSLPNTGIGDSIPSVVLVVVLGISAVYAYRKMQDYSNI